MATDKIQHAACATCGEPFTARANARYCSMICRSKGTRARHRAAVARAKEHGLNPGQQVEGDYFVLISHDDDREPFGLRVGLARATRVWRNDEGLQAEWQESGQTFSTLEIVAIPLPREADKQQISDGVRALAFLHQQHTAAKEMLTC